MGAAEGEGAEQASRKEGGTVPQGDDVRGGAWSLGTALAARSRGSPKHQSTLGLPAAGTQKNTVSSPHQTQEGGPCARGRAWLPVRRPVASLCS